MLDVMVTLHLSGPIGIHNRPLAACRPLHLDHTSTVSRRTWRGRCLPLGATIVHGHWIVAFLPESPGLRFIHHTLIVDEPLCHDHAVRRTQVLTLAAMYGRHDLGQHRIF